LRHAARGRVAPLSGGVLKAEQISRFPQSAGGFMAEPTHSGPAELGAPMDYPAHESTFAGFVAMTKIIAIGSAITVIALALYGFGSGGFWLGTILILLMIAATGISIVTKGSIKALVAVGVIGLIFGVLSLS
jgi:Bacterial aa3 type cytochrome c oxidase subunit IV